MHLLLSLLLVSLLTFVGSVPVPKALLKRSHGNFVPSIPKTFTIYPGAGVTLRRSNSHYEDPIEIATRFFAEELGYGSTLVVSSSHFSSHNGVTHVYFQQVVNGIPVVNGVGNVNVGSKGEILSYGNSFYNGAIPTQLSIPPFTPLNAVQSLANFLQYKEVEELDEERSPSLKYIQIEGGTELSLCWDIVIKTKDNMYNAIVNVNGEHEIVQLIDWVSDATYNVYPLGINDPHSGSRVKVVDPAHPKASPLGWHAHSSSVSFTTTIGNNVYAQENLDGGGDYLENYRPDGGSDLVFDHPIDFTKQPVDYLDGAITNLFYWNNAIHDLFYVYGFDEKAGNFQENNFDLGGAEGDGVYAQAQDGSGYNNANFMTPPDGFKGRMRMYVWTVTNPWRDGDLDGGIVMHEYLHGISTRLTGGPSNVGCLPSGESGGMGEGWGDLFATITRVTVNSTRDDVYEMGDYSNGGQGIRKFPYSTNLEVNPSTYNYVVRPGYGYVHAKGEVWAVILYEVFWNLVEKHGFDPDWFNVSGETEGNYISIINGQSIPRPPRKSASLGGNVITFQLLVDGMKLQPCNPTFVEARDAILEADSINNNGDNKCEIWRGFAKRGLGTEAAFEGKEDFQVPAECRNY